MTAGARYAIVACTAGGLAQLGERDNGIVEVTGSIPVSSTKALKKGRPMKPAFFIMVADGDLCGYPWGWPWEG